jgi:hypothetical protein
MHRRAGMMRKFLHSRGFHSPEEKACGFMLLVMIAMALLLLALIFMMVFVMFPVFSFIVVSLPLGAWLYFKLSKDICPLCDERVEKPDRHAMDCGNYCHKWCSHMLEETP